MIDQVIEPREVALVGDLKVRRILPFRARRMVGPFAFLDEMGPIELRPGPSGDVPPHPHIGLSTVTYLFDGELLHRDSIGSKQRIIPGDVNWMTAGKGIAHSERIPSALRTDSRKFHGMQAWVALPLEAEETDPTFDHYDRKALPCITVNGSQVTLIAGSAFGQASPVKTHSPLFYMEVAIPAGKSFRFDPDESESAFYVIKGRVTVEGRLFERPVLLVFKPGASIEILADEDTHGMFLGGAPLKEPRYIWWNFVSSSQDRIEKAKQSWREQKFPRIPEETELVPLPGETFPVDRSTLP